MKKYSSIILVLLLILFATVPASLVGAQSNSDFNEVIQKIYNSENLSLEEKEEVMDRAIELHYDEGVSLDQIFEILSQNDNYDDIENQFINLDINDDDDDDDDMMDDDDDMMDDDDDDMMDDDDEGDYDDDDDMMNDDDDDMMNDDDDDDYDDDDMMDDDDDEEDED